MATLASLDREAGHTLPLWENEEDGHHLEKEGEDSPPFASLEGVGHRVRTTLMLCSISLYWLYCNVLHCIVI